MNMKKTLLVILTGITPGITGGRCRHLPGGGPLPKPAAEPPGSGRAQPAGHGHSGRMTSPLPCSPACPASRTSASLFRSSPALDKLLRDLENQVCDAVVDRVNEHLPGNIDPLERL